MPNTQPPEGIIRPFRLRRRNGFEPLDLKDRSRAIDGGRGGGSVGFRGRGAARGGFFEHDFLALAHDFVGVAAAGKSVQNFPAAFLALLFFFRGFPAGGLAAEEGLFFLRCERCGGGLGFLGGEGGVVGDAGGVLGGVGGEFGFSFGDGDVVQEVEG